MKTSKHRISRLHNLVLLAESKVIREEGRGKWGKIEIKKFVICV
jgi:hypothetical protein